MTTEDAKRICQFIDKEMQSKKFNNVEIVFFGGEPLLNKKIIYYVCEKLNKKTYKTNYIIITNGYLLDKKTIEQLSKLNISQFSITVDGPRKIHNKTRILKNTQNKTIGTYNKILENIKILGDFNKIRVVVRMNVTKSNIDYIKDLINEISSVNKNVVYNIEPVFATSKFDKDLFTIEEYSKEVIKINKLLEKHIHDKHHKPFEIRSKLANCPYQNNMGFAIGPKCTMYSCSVKKLDSNNTIGILDKNLQTPKNPVNDFNPFEKEKCKRCVLFPICRGGCETTTKNNGDCLSEKFIFDEVVKYYYNAIQKIKSEKIHNNAN
jgi:uncharacterized protein